MQNKVISYVIATVVGLTVVTAGVITYKTKFQNSSDSNTTTKSESTKTQPVNNKTSAISNIKNLFTQKKGIKCSAVEGDLYIDPKNERIALEVKSNDTITHMIFKDNVVYMWTEGQDEGFKMSQDTFEGNNADENEDIFLHFWDSNNTPEKLEDYFNKNGIATYNCNEWNANDKTFEIPDSVNLTDLDQYKEVIEKQTQELQSQCDQLSGDEKEECLKFSDPGIF